MPPIVAWLALTLCAGCAPHPSAETMKTFVEVQAYVKTFHQRLQGLIAKQAPLGQVEQSLQRPVLTAPIQVSEAWNIVLCDADELGLQPDNQLTFQLGDVGVNALLSSAQLGSPISQYWDDAKQMQSDFAKLKSLTYAAVVRVVEFIPVTVVDKPDDTNSASSSASAEPQAYFRGGQLRAEIFVIDLQQDKVIAGFPLQESLEEFSATYEKQAGVAFDRNTEGQGDAALARLLQQSLIKVIDNWNDVQEAAP